MVLIPLVLVVVFLVPAVLLQALFAPLVLVATTALSFGASFGLANLLWRYGLGYPGIEAQLPLYVFVFLVALGVDYNIFLAARIREEARSVSTRQGAVRRLAVTGGVITAAFLAIGERAWWPREPRAPTPSRPYEAAPPPPRPTAPANRPPVDVSRRDKTGGGDITYSRGFTLQSRVCAGHGLCIGHCPREAPTQVLNLWQ